MSIEPIGQRGPAAPPSPVAMSPETVRKSTTPKVSSAPSARWPIAAPPAAPNAAAPDRWNGHDGRNVLAYARLAEAVYSPTDQPAGWTRLPGWTVDGRASGLKAALFENTRTGEFVLAFAGTDLNFRRGGWRAAARDALTNILQGFAVPTQYREAVQLARRVRRAFGPDTILVGHSLGGGLASWASAHTKLRGVAFNAAGLGLEARARLWLAGRLKSAAAKVTHINVRGEILSAAPLLPDGGLGPRQLGAQRTLDPRHSPPTGAVRWRNAQPLVTAAQWTANAVSRLPQRIENHGLAAVIGAIEQALEPSAPLAR